ncbi:unnamed protein product [Adineta ricciae]|uniref:Tyrosine specific protein phosphatases domain-containing protein n=1 Tax=Adineta ricciae TaxID=249248 RepID=A0A814L7D7_ADIRI|nr:unnamed protein product [Adineta ricciae]
MSSSFKRSRTPERHQRRRRTNNKVPTGWLDYTPLNTWIENTRIIPFKCPLKRSILRHLQEDERFSLDDLTDRLANQGRKIGLIIDLTDTDRYYDYRDVEDMDIEYCKIRVPGHQDVPEHSCRKFFRVVDSFLRDNRHNDKLIGIHCTHGINRSGYFIVRYLIEVFGLEPNDAISAFNRARGHQMEKYTDDLRRRIPGIATQVTSSDSDENDYYVKRDRPLPYTRPSVDPMSNDCSAKASEINL